MKYQIKRSVNYKAKTKSKIMNVARGPKNYVGNTYSKAKLSNEYDNLGVVLGDG